MRRDASDDASLFYFCSMSYQYFLVYKPFGVLSQFTTPTEDKVGLGSLFDFPRDVYPVGRLDEDSEGLLLLTNDSSLNRWMLGTQVEKEYWVQVEGVPTEEALKALRQGVVIRVNKKEHHCLPATVQEMDQPAQLPPRVPPIRYRASIPTSWLKIVIREGKNRQVRRMTAVVGLPTLRLIRVRFGTYMLGDMQPGQVKAFQPGSGGRL